MITAVYHVIKQVGISYNEDAVVIDIRDIRDNSWFISIDCSPFYCTVFSLCSLFTVHCTSSLSQLSSLDLVLQKTHETAVPELARSEEVFVCCVLCVLKKRNRKYLVPHTHTPHNKAEAPHNT
jgi:hypothetical protein